MGIVVKRNGEVIVTEYENHRIKVFSQENLGQSITIGAVGVGSGKFSCPRGVALDQHDNIVVADSQNHRIQVVSSTGEPLGTFGMIGSEPGYLDTPYDVAMDPAGNIIVADAKNHRLQVFTRLVPVYTEHATYEEEYEGSVKKENSDSSKRGHYGNQPIREPHLGHVTQMDQSACSRRSCDLSIKLSCQLHVK